MPPRTKPTFQATLELAAGNATVVVSVFEDRTFELWNKTPPTAFLIRKALLEAAIRTIAGTARSMGVAVQG